MMYTTVTIGEKDLKLRLDARNCVDLERKMGKSPLDVFVSAQTNGKVPGFEDLIFIFHSSLQKYNKGFTLDKTYDLYDEYIEAGNTLEDFVPLIMEILKVSGFFKEENIDNAEVIEEKKQKAVI